MIHRMCILSHSLINENSFVVPHAFRVSNTTRDEAPFDNADY